MDENEILRKQLHELNKAFDYQEFFSYSGNGYHSASTLITPSQAITLPNIDNYTGDHLPTMEQAIQGIYDLPYKRKNILTVNKYDLAMSQSIRFRIMNQFGTKAIWILFPDQIVKTQLDLLQAYQNTYGDIVKQFSIPYSRTNQSGESIVGFRTQDRTLVLCHSFEKAIEYAKTLPIVETPDIPDEFIIGSVVSPDKSTLYSPDLPISLHDRAQQALDNGATFEDCNFATGHENLLKHDRTGVYINE